MTHYQKARKQSGFYTFFSLYIFATIITDTIRSLAEGPLPQMVPYVNIVRNLIYIIIVCYLLIFELSLHLNIRVLLLVLVTLIISLLSYMAMPQLAPIMPQYILMLFSRFFPGLLFAFAIEDTSTAFDSLRKFLFIAYIYSFVCIIFSQIDYMTFSYNLLIPCLIQGAQAIRSKRITDWIACFWLLFCIFFFGSRGSFVCIMVAAIVALLYYVMNASRKKKFFIIIGSILVASIIAIYYWEIVLFLYQLIPESRNIALLINGKFFSSNVRDEISNLLLQDVISHPLQIRGIMSDRVRYMDIAGNISFTNYAHNIIVELFHEFGLFIGTIINLIIIMQVLNSFFSLRNSSFETKSLYIIFVPTTYIMMLFSGSMFSLFQFWVMLGLIINFNKNKRKLSLVRS